MCVFIDVLRTSAAEIFFVKLHNILFFIFFLERVCLSEKLTHVEY